MRFHLNQNIKFIQNKQKVQLALKQISSKCKYFFRTPLKEENNVKTENRNSADYLLAANK